MSPATASPTVESRLAVFTLGVMGAVSLVFQIVWARQLTTLLGSTVTAVALVTSMFMVGMALGAWVMGRRSDVGTDPIRLLGWLSIGLGVTGAAAVPLYRAAFSLYAAGALDPSRASLLGLASALAAAMTPLPTAFVGAAFPVAARALSVRRRDITSGASATYVAGTVGSVLGALVGGFALVPALGITGTLLASSGLTAALGVVLLVASRGRAISRTVSESATAASEETATLRGARSTLVAFTLSGAAIMVYEAVWTRELLLVFGATVYAVATMLAATLTGLAIGQWLGGRNREDRMTAATAIGFLQLTGAGSAMLSLLIVRGVPIAYYAFRSAFPRNAVVFVLAEFALAFVVVAVPCAFLGATAPIATRLATSHRHAMGREIGAAYALNTSGAVIGALAGGLVLLPSLSTAGSSAVAAALNVLAAIIMFRIAFASESRSIALRRAVPSVAIAAVGLTSLLTINAASPLLELAATPPVESVSARDLYALARQMTVVYSKDAPQGRVTVLESPDGTLALRASGVNEGGIQAESQTTEAVVRVPVAIMGELSDVLIVGLGAGGTTTAALGAPGEPRVDTVEINPAIVEASRYFMEEPITANPRATIITDDARHYYTTADRTYDVIASQPSLPLSTYSARMFTKESFEAASRNLKPGGLMVQWLPAYLTDDADFRMMTKTFATVFPNTHVWVLVHPDNPDSRVDYLLVGVNGSSTIDPEEVEARLAADGGEPLRLQYLMGPDDLADLLGDESVPLNVDDHPIFEYHVPMRYLQLIWN